MVPLVGVNNEPFTINRAQRPIEPPPPQVPLVQVPLVGVNNEPFTINRAQRSKVPLVEVSKEPVNRPYNFNVVNKMDISKEETQTDWKNIRNKVPLINTKPAFSGKGNIKPSGKGNIKPSGKGDIKPGDSLTSSDSNDFISKYYKKS
jgi:hypothetical protein